MFFRLLPEVYLIIGKHKSILQNILNKKIFWIENDIAKLIKLCENNKQISGEFLEYASQLKDHGWGTITYSPIFVDKLRFLAFNDQRQLHKKPLVISHATIKLTDKYNLNCTTCSKVFCQLCVKTCENTENLSLDHLKSFIMNIKRYGCKTVLLTGGEITIYSDLKNVYDFLLKNGFNIVLSTNGIHKLDNYFARSNIVISAFKKELLSVIIKNYKDFKNITLCTYFEDQENILGMPDSWTVIKRSYYPHKITRRALLGTDIYKFYNKQMKSTCLNGKITIAQSGNIYPCLEAIKSAKPVGNICNDSWEEIMHNLSYKYWNNKIDDHNICGKCEFRYTCNACVFDNIKENCCYHMEDKVWT